MFSFDNFLLDNMPIRSKYIYDRFCDPELAYWPNDTWRIRSPKRKNVSSGHLYNHFINGLIDEILDPRYDSDVDMEIEYQPKQKQQRNQPAKVENCEKQCTPTKETEKCCNNKPSEVAVPNENKDLQLAKPTEINLRLSHYKPEDISVEVKDGILTLKAKKEHKDDSSYSYQSFERSFSLPENVDQQKISCQMDANGSIKLNIPHKPLQKAVEEPKEREIKIIHETADKKEEQTSVKSVDDEPVVQDLIEE